MKKLILLILCGIAYTQSVSAALVTSIVTNGNSVLTRGSGLGVTRLAVDFNNLSSIHINFDTLSAEQDDIFMDINNNTGTGWSGFNFELVGVGFFGPLSLTTKSGTFVDWVFYGSDPLTGLNTGADVVFSPFEDLGFSATGNVDTRFVGEYSLILTPTVVPVPAAVWLFASGLLGLIGVARYKA